jgi:hypothetical protein
MAADNWYRITAVFGPRRAELWVGPTKVANMSLDLWNLTDVSGGRIHLGHDPRYAFYERLFFGQVIHSNGWSYFLFVVIFISSCRGFVLIVWCSDK